MISTLDSVLDAGGGLIRGLPSFSWCPGQIAAAKVVAEAIRAGEHLVIEAPPHVSPGIFCCVPAILDAVPRGGRVLVVASEMRHEQLTQVELPFLQRVLPAPFDFAQLPKAGEGETVGPGKGATVYVTSYQVLFAQLAQLGTTGLIDEWLPPDLVVLESAHEAARLGRLGLGFRLSHDTLAALTHPLTTLDESALREQILTLSKRFFTELATHSRSKRYHFRLEERQAIPNFELLDGLERAARVFERAASEARLDAPWHELSIRCRLAASRIDRAMELIDSNVVFYFEEDGTGLGVLCAQEIDIARHLERALFSRASSVIVTSSALTCGGSFDQIRTELGIPDRAREHIVPSSPEHVRKALLVVPDDVPDPSERGWPGIVALRCAQAIRGIPGRVVCMFGSRHSLDLAWHQLRNEPRQVFREGDTPQGDLMRLYQADPSGVLLITTTGWGALDFSAVTIACLILDRLPFPPSTDPVLDAIKERDSGWFVHQSLPAAVRTFQLFLTGFVQKPQGQRVVVVLDQRLLNRPYGRLFLEGFDRIRTSRSLDEIKPFLSAQDREIRP